MRKEFGAILGDDKEQQKLNMRAILPVLSL
eukprot:COSAG02_NODE_25515_length_656_cov_1.412926_1_plen_29_part_10